MFKFIRRHYLKGTYSDDDLLLLVRAKFITEDEMAQLIDEKEALEAAEKAE